MAGRGWRSKRLHDSATFMRLHVSGDEELIVEFAIDSAAGRPPVVSIVGPTFDPEELAGRKLLALFGRAEARDFADVYVLAQRFGRPMLLERAREVDPGFDSGVLAEMLRTLDRFVDDEIPIEVDQVPYLRAFFHSWAPAGQLRTRQEATGRGLCDSHGHWRSLPGTRKPTVTRR